MVPVSDALSMMGIIIATTISWTLLAVLVSQPFEGAIIRLRAHYNPKSISLDGEDTRTHPELKGVFSTIQRTMAWEGWWGIYKGAYATIATALVATIPSLCVTAYLLLTDGLPGSVPVPWTLAALRLSVGVSNSFVKMDRMNNTTSSITSEPDRLLHGLASLTVGLTTVLLLIPFTIIINRAIVTPYKVPFSLSGALKTLLTKRERSSPSLLYRTPGLALGTLLSLVPLLALDFFMYDTPLSPLNGTTRALVYVGISTLSAAVIVPLKVVVIKVSVQPTLPRAQSEGEEELLVAENAEDIQDAVPGIQRCSSTEEDVVNLRSPFPKYTGLIDAIRTITAEEGWQALYRGWIWTTLGLFLASLLSIPPPRH